jgi:myo-inositol-1(or 4)-monophosphatase
MRQPPRRTDAEAGSRRLKGVSFAAPDRSHEARLEGAHLERWLALCRAAVVAQRQIFREHTGIGARTVYEGKGEGGDWSLAIDRRCEEAVFTELETLAAEGHSFVAVSEERGEVQFGGSGSELRVVIDPIDGSLNARRTVPSHSLSIAVAAGPSMAEVELGFVYDFGADEEFVARLGGGAALDGERLRADAHAQGLELVGVEAAKPQWMAAAAAALDGHVYRLRGIGSIAISLCYVAAGRFDGMLSLRDSRSVDAAAGQLVAREAGAEVAFGEVEPSAAGLGIDERYPIAAAVDGAGLGRLREAQVAVEAGR